MKMQMNTDKCKSKEFDFNQCETVFICGKNSSVKQRLGTFSRSG